MELPTPGNADSAKQRKHREQAIVIGTVALVLLTYMLLRRSSSASGSPFSPTDMGSNTPDSSLPLPGMIAGIPGQVAALEQGNASKQGRQISALRKRINNLNKRLAKQSKTNHRQSQQITKLTHELHHPKAPAHPIHVTHRARHPQQTKAGHEHFVGVAVHPPQHGGKKAPANNTLRWGSLYKEQLKPAK